MSDESNLTNSGKIEAGRDVVGRDVVTNNINIYNAPPSPTVDEAPAPGASPYMGMQYFDEGDAANFFGREALTATLVGRLRHQRFLAVVGASGSGKSSVVRAGVVPALRHATPLADGTLPPPGSDRWQIQVITPTAHPLKELAAALTQDSESVTATATLMDDLARDSRSLDLAATRFLKHPKHAGPCWLLVVDQFEELFTLCQEATERRAFVDALCAAVATEGPVRVVLTLRADFYHHCAQYDALRKLLAAEQEYIGAMTAAELRAAIECPAHNAQWELEPELVDALLCDVGVGAGQTPEPGALPLLSHALLETWKRRRGRRLTLHGYAEAGGVRGAIARTAEAVYQQLPAPHQAIARNVFVRLTALGEGSQDTRRRADLAELTPDHAQRAGVDAVLQTLADARLIVKDTHTAEVAHEALIREWPTLRGWLDADREGLRLHRHLTEAATEWDKRGRKPEDLYRGTRLVQAQEWVNTHTDQLSAAERAFLQASTAALTTERRATRLRWASIVGSISFALVVVSTIITLATTGQLNHLIYRPLPMEFVTVPAGEFLMGSTDEEIAVSTKDCPDCDFSSEQPQHTVYLDAYEIGKYEVTNTQYAQCIKAGECRPLTNSRYMDVQDVQHPVVEVNWNDAQTFCAWNGGRLPTEAEWEKAARGADGRLFPWGDDEPTANLLNFSHNLGDSRSIVSSTIGVQDTTAGLDMAGDVFEWAMAWYSSNVGGTRPIGSYPAGVSPYGALDMAGNVFEWTEDWYSEDYYVMSPSHNPQGPDIGDSRVLRGGAFNTVSWSVRSAFRVRIEPGVSVLNVGFRCVISRASP